MSKSQEKTATGVAKNENATYDQNAQTSYNAAQKDVGNYEGDLAKYASENPFTTGGAYQTAQNAQLADTAGAASQAAKQAAQSAAVRSGGNPAAAIAAGEQAGEVNARTQMGDVAAANQSRIAQGAGYDQNVLNASAKPEEMEAELAVQQGQLGNGALGDEVSAAKTPSYLDELVNGGIAAASQSGAAYAKGCWIAARLYGGWLTPETVAIRLWLTYGFGRRWYGKPLIALYARYGERVASGWMPRSPLLTRAMSWLFGLALSRAVLWQKTDKGMLLWKAHEELMRQRRLVTTTILHEKTTADWAIRQAGEVL